MSVADRLHDLLLHLAGRVPDDFLAAARVRLTAGTAGEVAAEVCAELSRRKVAVTIAQAGLLSQLVEDSASAVFAGIPIVDDEPALEWLFEESPQRQDAEDVTAALVGVLTHAPSARGLWLSWRTPFRGAGEPLPVHVVTAAEDLPRLSAELHAALADRPGTPRVEVVGPDEVPAYQRAARARGALVWAATEPPELFVARVFDHVSPDGVPSFGDDHPRLTDQDERERVLAYLRSGEVLLETAATMDDAVRPERGEVVPTSYYTDGVWLWPEAVTYYLQEYDLAPDERFLAHIRAAGRPPERLDAVSAHRALRHLLAPAN